MKLKKLVAGLGILGLAMPAPLAAQRVIETAKPADTVSPYGVSYTTGSFAYSLPVLEIGNGEWPGKLSVVLQYDSSANRQPNKAWSFNVGSRLSKVTLVPGVDFKGDPDETQDLYGISVVFGNSAVSFEKTGCDLTSGEYYPGTVEGHSLTYEPLPGSSTCHWSEEGRFVFTSRNGDVFKESPDHPWIMTGEHSLANGRTAKWSILPNGSNVLETNNGIAILIEQTSFAATVTKKLCVYNFALIDRSTVQDCSQSNQSATITYASADGLITSARLPDGQIYSFEYVTITDLAGPNQWEDVLMPPRTRSHLSCIKKPGQGTCAVLNEYDACDGPGAMFEDDGWTGSRDRVKKQTLADGRIITYSYAPTNLPCRGISSVTKIEAGASTTIGINATDVLSVQDPLSRVTGFQWTGGNPQAPLLFRDGLLASNVLPEGDTLNYSYDARGNAIEARRKAKPNSGLGDLVQSAVYPATCVNPKTCNKPTSTTDARGNTTTYVYDTNHGGVLSETGPVVNGVRPQKRYSYAQRYAWIRSGATYVQAATPMWLLASESFCRTSAWTGSACAVAGDEVVTIYDYGPNSGPNNLWLRGVMVTADGQSRRTCFGYDNLGRKISETTPNANLTSCP